MNHKIKEFILSKKHIISKTCLFIAIFLMNIAAVSAVISTSSYQSQNLETDKLFESSSLKAYAQFSLDEGQGIKLKVTKIPTEYPWINRDLSGNVVAPEIGSIIIAQNTEAIQFKDMNGLIREIPAGSRFYGTVEAIKAPRRFQKDGYITVNFNKLKIKTKSIELENPVSISTEAKPSVKSKLKKAATVGAYTLGGSLAGPILTYSILSRTASVFGGALMTNPYVLGGSAAAGGAAGLAVGLLKKGKLKNLEPGTELKLELSNSWLLSAEQQMPFASPKESNKNIEAYTEAHLEPELKPVEINIVEVKKSKDIYGSKGLLVTFDYKNNSTEPLRYTSFKLYDSMGKEYEISPRKFEDSIFGEVPKAGRLSLNFPTDFPKAIHELKALKRFNQKALGSAKVLL